MAETFALPPAARGALLDDPALRARWALALPQIDAVLDGETDAVALQSTLACLLYAALPHATWCGFYRRVAPELLAVGPYQGAIGCLRIPFARGVCGAAARTGEVQRVPDVERFPGHIACDAKTRSELVVPVFDHEGTVRAVLDLDAEVPDAFSPWQAEALDALCRRVFSVAAVRW